MLILALVISVQKSITESYVPFLLQLSSVWDAKWLFNWKHLNGWWYWRDWVEFCAVLSIRYQKRSLCLRVVSLRCVCLRIVSQKCAFLRIVRQRCVFKNCQAEMCVWELSGRDVCLWTLSRKWVYKNCMSDVCLKIVSQIGASQKWIFKYWQSEMSVVNILCDWIVL